MTRFVQQSGSFGRNACQVHRPAHCFAQGWLGHAQCQHRVPHVEPNHFMKASISCADASRMPVASSWCIGDAATADLVVADTHPDFGFIFEHWAALGQALTEVVPSANT